MCVWTIVWAITGFLGPLEATDGCKFEFNKRFMNAQKMLSLGNVFHLGSSDQPDPEYYEFDVQYQQVEPTLAMQGKYVPMYSGLQGVVQSNISNVDVVAQFAV
jgi:hypothetical protein